MIESEDLIGVGKIGKTFGVEGELILNLTSSAFTNSINEGCFVIIDLKGDFVPFQVIKWIPESERMKLKYIDRVEEAKPLTGRNCYLLIGEVDVEEILTTHRLSDVLLLDLKWTLFDKERNFRTNEIRIIEMPQQILASFIYEEKEILLPLHSETIVKIEVEKAQIHVTIDQSIIDLYN